jgi:hypothetical protein
MSRLIYWQLSLLSSTVTVTNCQPIQYSPSPAPTSVCMREAWRLDRLANCNTTTSHQHLSPTPHALPRIRARDTWHANSVESLRTSRKDAEKCRTREDETKSHPPPHPPASHASPRRHDPCTSRDGVAELNTRAGQERDLQCSWSSTVIVPPCCMLSTEPHRLTV